MAEWTRLEDSVTGYGLWQEPTEAGGHRYYTDDNSIGRICWDDAIDNPIIVFEILDRQGGLDFWLAAYKNLKENK